MVLVMEIAAGGELYDYLSERKTLEEKEASAGASLFISTTITTIYTILVKSVLSIIVQSVLSIFHHHLWQGIKAKIAVGSVVAGKNLIEKAMGCPSGRKHTLAP